MYVLSTQQNISVTYKGAQVVKYLVKGTPQGSVLSPLMWLLGFEGFLELFPDKGRIRIIGFADDAILVIRGPNPVTLVKFMQIALNKTVDWGRKNELEFSPQKTVVVMFTRKRKKVDYPRLCMGNFEIPYSKQVKYLGVWMDSKLSWRFHVNKKLAAAKKLLYKLRNVTGRIWGLKNRLGIWVFRAIIRPMFTYGCLVWCKVAEKAWFIKSTQRLQRLALNLLGNFRRSTPTAGLEVITYTSPLWLHVL